MSQQTRVAMAHVVSAFGAEHCVRRRVDAGLGQDVAPVAQRVSPGPKPEGRVLGKPTEAPAGTHEGAAAFTFAVRCTLVGITITLWDLYKSQQPSARCCQL